MSIKKIYNQFHNSKNKHKTLIKKKPTSFYENNSTNNQKKNTKLKHPKT